MSSTALERFNRLNLRRFVIPSDAPAHASPAVVSRDHVSLEGVLLILLLGIAGFNVYSIIVGVAAQPAFTVENHSACARFRCLDWGVRRWMRSRP